MNIRILEIRGVRRMQNTPPECGGLTFLRLHLMRGLHTLSPHHVDRAALLPAGCSE